MLPAPVVFAVAGCLPAPAPPPHDGCIARRAAQGVDLRHYSRQIERDLKSVEQLSISDCTFRAQCAKPFDSHTPPPSCPRRHTPAPLAHSVSPRGPLPHPPYADVREADHIALLFQQVTACEEVLGGMQEMLQGFRSNLGNISQEIKSLQNDSLTMNIKLNNRRAVHARLTTFLDKVAVSEDMILTLCEVR
jgi:hypothetical protein